jgi:hypothetical protein
MGGDASKEETSESITIKVYINDKVLRQETVNKQLITTKRQLFDHLKVEYKDY